MSHFTVLVPAENEKELGRKLAPYQENNMEDCPKEYLEFNQGDEEDYPWDEAEQAYGYWENPNAKWDWWEIGGRWTGTLKVKPHVNRELAGVSNGNPGLMTQPNEDMTKADTLRKGDLDLDFHKNESRMKAEERWLTWHNGDRPEDMESREFSRWLVDNGFWAFTEKEGEELESKTIEEYSELHGAPNSISYAFIDLEGQWNERGRMGWWGASALENDDSYHQDFWRWIESLPNDIRLYLVDCHI